MSEVPKLKDFLHVVKDESRRKLCDSILKAYDDDVTPVMGTLARETLLLVLTHSQVHQSSGVLITKLQFHVGIEACNRITTYNYKTDSYRSGVPFTGTSMSRTS